MIIFIIWILGCFINYFIIYKKFYVNNDKNINYLDFDYLVNLIEDIFKSLFIFSSFIGTICYLILKTYIKKWKYFTYN